MTTAAPTSLDEQLRELQSRIKADASNSKLRVHLFQLLCVMGNWQRALAQLQLCAQLDPKALAMAQTYREAIRNELFRAEVFAGRRAPQVMGQPPGWIGLLIEALKREATGSPDAASALREKALDEAEPRACRIDDSDCEWVADADSRLGPVCEVIANGQYYWLPFSACNAIRLEKPADLRDLVWAPAEILLPNEGRVPALIPSRYPGTENDNSASADALRQSRQTLWLDRGNDVWHGLGQRLWASDIGEHPILDTRSITFVDTPEFVKLDEKTD
jgi:type VI secretion system protein ImpE